LGAKTFKALLKSIFFPLETGQIGFLKIKNVVITKQKIFLSEKMVLQKVEIKKRKDRTLPIFLPSKNVFQFTSFSGDLATRNISPKPQKIVGCYDNRTCFSLPSLVWQGWE
jgi:hypothetical protein